MDLTSKITGMLGKSRKKFGEGPKGRDKITSQPATPAIDPVSHFTTAAPASQLAEVSSITTIIAQSPPAEEPEPAIAQVVNSSPRPAPSVSALPTASDAAAAPLSHDNDPWTLAYDILQKRQPELVEDYKKHLAPLQGNAVASADLSSPRVVKSFVEKLLEDREERRWRVALLGKPVIIREQAEKLVKFLLWTDPIVKNAINAQPYAALAWSAVSAALPLLASGTTQNEVMLRGFNSIGDFQLYWNVCEDRYIRSLHRQSHQDLIEPLAQLYSHIMEYQARVICHLSKAQLSRAWQDVTGGNTWDSIIEKITGLSNACSDLIPHLKEAEIRDRWNHQLQEMQESRIILDEIRRAVEQSATQTLQIYEDQKERALLQDLISCASEYEDFKTFNNPPRVDRTCEWFFNDKSFQKWRDCPTSSILWVSASPGCGKSVLSRALIDERRLSINTTTSTICHFFFKDGDERRMYSTNALCAILHQLFTQDSTRSLIGKALASHKEYGKSLTQTLSKLWQILEDCTGASDAGEVVCILDALDECEANSRQRLMDRIKEFYYKQDLSKDRSKLKFLITSRPYPDLEISFDKFSHMTVYLHSDGDSDKMSAEISDEINFVIDARLQDITRGFTDKDRDTISEDLKNMKNRTYLWLHLTLDIIEQRGSESRSDVEELLSELSDEVSAKYEKILSQSTNKTQTEILLRILLAAVRPLTIDEANIALKLALQKKQFSSHKTLQSESWTRENFQRKVRNLCGLFVGIHDSKLSFITKQRGSFLYILNDKGYGKGA